MIHKCQIANKIWKQSALPAHRRFETALTNCDAVQKQYLLTLLGKNQETLFGKKHLFSSLSSVEEFQKKVPLTNYEDYLPYIDKISNGDSKVLTDDKVLLFEPSSGTSSAKKLIPYTATLKKEFQNAISPWIVSLFFQYPEISKGRAYWSISPSVTEDKSKHDKVPIGFDNDWEYLGILGKILFSCTAILPKNISEVKSIEKFRNTTLASMLAAEDLTLISVWSPSFLTLLLDWYIEHGDEVLEIIASKQIASSQRIKALERTGNNKSVFEEIWPNLQLISCWTDATSQQEAIKLQEYFSQTKIQGKGLLATEAFVSLPFSEKHDPVLAVTSHFFEFMSEKGDILLAHQLEKDCEYTVVVTTGGGLYRYCLNDRIFITGFIGNTPTLRFIGKNDHISDRYGEKINALHAAGISKSLLNNIDSTFTMIAPDKLNGGYSYTLYVESQDTLPRDIAKRLENMLQENPHYKYCIDLGQLYPARVFHIKANANATYEARLISEGQMHGNIKLAPLSCADGWSNSFEGRYLD